LESVYTLIAYRGFESHSLRHCVLPLRRSALYRRRLVALRTVGRICLPQKVEHRAESPRRRRRSPRQPGLDRSARHAHAVCQLARANELAGLAYYAAVNRVCQSALLRQGGDQRYPGQRHDRQVDFEEVVLEA
jgi:hypothetical protein